MNSYKNKKKILNSIEPSYTEYNAPDPYLRYRTWSTNERNNREKLLQQWEDEAIIHNKTLILNIFNN